MPRVMRIRFIYTSNWMDTHIHTRKFTHTLYSCGISVRQGAVFSDWLTHKRFVRLTFVKFSFPTPGLHSPQHSHTNTHTHTPALRCHTALTLLRKRTHYNITSSIRLEFESTPSLCAPFALCRSRLGSSLRQAGRGCQRLRPTLLSSVLCDERLVCSRARTHKRAQTKSLRCEYLYCGKT